MQPQPISRPYEQLAIDGTLALARGTVDRAAERRRDASWLEQAWADERSRVLVVVDVTLPVAPGGDDVERRLRWAAPSTVDQRADRFLLAVDADGRATFAITDPHGLPEGADPDPGVDRMGLRELGPLLGDDEAALAAHAVGLAHWHASHPCCARCGARTVVEEAGHVRRCPVDGSQHFPRTDPAVIVLVTDREGRALLARSPAWPETRYSTLAGFVEPGESLEQALRREVHEEVGLHLDDVRYAGSQPWPFPASLMCGYYARVDASAPELVVDGAEIADGRWLTRDDLTAAIATGELSFPSSVSIARRLIEGWYGNPLPAG